MFCGRTFARCELRHLSMQRTFEFVTKPVREGQRQGPHPQRSQEVSPLPAASSGLEQRTE